MYKMIKLICLQDCQVSGFKDCKKDEKIEVDLDFSNELVLSGFFKLEKPKPTIKKEETVLKKKEKKDEEVKNEL